jgi:FkbM family methyltransferase
MYSVWAAALHGARVFAFEPEAQNYALLNRNIALNGLQGRVRAYCLALSDRAGWAELHVSSLVPGSSLHSFGEQLDFKLEPMRAEFSQGCMSATLDGLVGGGALPQPTHLKIDVDGFEHRVVAGARDVLRDPRLRLVQVEINRNLEEHRAIVEALAAGGWRYDPAQVAAAERSEGDFKGLAEYVFRR